ncbi:hypothetical protein EI94DRAFT_1789748 [Lactarius quietus]|nr:hypothetical protein EI94DRAFT_1789748 [Lactarius quietus]
MNQIQFIHSLHAGMFREDHELCNRIQESGHPAPLQLKCIARRYGKIVDMPAQTQSRYELDAGDANNFLDAGLAPDVNRRSTINDTTKDWTQQEPENDMSVTIPDLPLLQVCFKVRWLYASADTFAPPYPLSYETPSVEGFGERPVLGRGVALFVVLTTSNRFRPRPPLLCREALRGLSSIMLIPYAASAARSTRSAGCADLARAGPRNVKAYFTRRQRRHEQVVQGKWLDPQSLPRISEMVSKIRIQTTSEVEDDGPNQKDVFYRH